MLNDGKKIKPSLKTGFNFISVDISSLVEFQKIMKSKMKNDKDHNN